MGKIHSTNPYLEPINGTAINERWEHPESVSEGIADGAHGQDHVEVFANFLCEVVVHG